jgi:monoamine oxidase
VKRRKALKSIGLGVTAGLALPWLSSCTEEEAGPEVNYDGVVGIIGAGAAGLFAADYLIAKGVKVKIFEASNRIGGRVRSIRTSDPLFNDLIADFPIELGADRVLGADSEWGNLISLLKVPTVDFRGAEVNAIDKYFLDNQYRTSAEVATDPDFLALVNFRDNILPGYAGGGSVQTAAAASGVSARVNSILNSWLGNAYGSSSNNISANALGEALSLIEHDGRELTLNINPMSDVLISRFSRATAKVQFNKAIEFVDYSGESITLSVKDTVTSEVTSETVNKLIVAVPISILKAGDIGFNPALPSTKATAMSKIGMDASIRIILEFNRNDIFGADTGFIFGGTESPSSFLSGVGRSDETKNRTFSFTINGPKAAELSALTDLEKVERVLTEMDNVSPSLFATRDVRHKTDDQFNDLGIIYVVQDWTKEPYIKGGQSYPLVGGTNNDRVTLAAPVGEDLYFAGEATDVTGEFGTVSGALKSGRRAAEEVIASIVG